MTSISPLQERAQVICDAVLDLKAEKVVVLDVHELSAFADAFVIASGTSDRHLRAIADKVVEVAKATHRSVLGIEGYDEAQWILIDLSDVIVHLFLNDVREHYDLERLWSDAERLFESQLQTGEVSA